MIPQLHLHTAQQTDIGLKRSLNEDTMISVIPEDAEVMAKKGALFVVADGLGGQTAGELASELAIKVISQSYYTNESADISNALKGAIEQANAAIYKVGSKMGTTCVAAVLHGNTVYVGNVGDSRAYIVRKGQIQRITEDHSWVVQQIKAGLLTEEQARTHENRNVIYRCLGGDAVEVDMFSVPVQNEDVLLLCTDGLTGLINDEELGRIVEQFEPQESVSRLVKRANEEGGPDNITAVVVRVSLEESEELMAS